MLTIIFFISPFSFFLLCYYYYFLFLVFQLVNFSTGESRRIEEDLNHSMKVVVPDFPIKRFYFSSLADDSPLTVFSS